MKIIKKSKAKPEREYRILEENSGRIFTERATSFHRAASQASKKMGIWPSVKDFKLLT